MSDEWELTNLNDVPTERQLRKLARSTMPSWKVSQLRKQGGLCLLCMKPIDLKIKGEGVVDHDHESGEVRGILHRSCNAAEGKVANAAGRWGAGGMSYVLIVPWLKNLIRYLEQPGCGVLYHTHETPEEKRLKRNKAAREARASSAARGAVRKAVKRGKPSAV